MSNPTLADFASASPVMSAFMALVERVVGTDSSLLILGETGAGKERLARAIHAESRRASGPFVAVNCAALPETLLESELFGHELGAFTGATRARRGWFELAHGGTLFLDEIGELPVRLQVKLLRALQEREVQPIGAERSIRVDVRVMAASNRDLKSGVAAGEFRRDLYYRLSVVTLSPPALRDRREDIPSLARRFIARFAEPLGRAPRDLTPEALDALVRYDWPGNVRELMNVIERGVVLCDGDRLGVEHLSEVIPRTETPAAGTPPPAEVLAGVASQLASSGWLGKPWSEVRRDALDALEREYLAALLRDTGGRVGLSASRAGMTPRSLYEKMKRHGLAKEDFTSTVRRTGGSTP